MSNRFERYPRVFLSVVIAITLFFTLVAAELLARQFLPQWAPMTAERSQFWRFDKILGWHHIPNKTSRFSHPDFSVSVSINSDGLRDRNYSKQKNEKKRMLVLGDSYGWGFGVQDQEVFSELLEARHSDWEIINASVSGYGTVQEYLYYRDKGSEYDSDVVLLLFHDNDFQDNVGATDYWYSKPAVIKNENNLSIGGTPLPQPSLQQRIQTCLLGNFYLGRIFYSVVSTPLSLWGTGSASARTQAPESFSATAYALNELAELIHSNNKRLVIVSTPLSEAKQAVIAGVCQQHQLSCLQLNAVFRQHKDEKWHFEHDPHWNAFGHQLVADTVDGFLVDAGLW